MDGQMEFRMVSNVEAIDKPSTLSRSNILGSLHDSLAPERWFKYRCPEGVRSLHWSNTCGYWRHVEAGLDIGYQGSDDSESIKEPSVPKISELAKKTWGTQSKM